MKKLSPEEMISSWAEQCRKSYEQWQSIFENGCHDPFWEDVINLNLVRNHIIYFQRQMNDLCEEIGYLKPEICSREIPKAVDPRYMARTEEIENQARKSLILIEQFDDYWKLFSFENQLTDEQKTAVYYSVTLGYVNNLKNAIDSKDYVAMRRYRDGAWILESISKCLEQIKRIQQ